MQDLTVSLVQYNIVWENKQQNVDYLEKKLEQVRDKTDIVVLPEMFSTGFSMNVEYLAENFHGPSLRWLKRKAKYLNAVVSGSFIAVENGKYYNRLFWVTPKGVVSSYDKRHLFRMADEHQSYSPGTASMVVKANGWNVSPFICYDLRFPVWSRNIANAFDLMIFVANWPDQRSDHWQTLLKARAIENQAYVVGVNRIGSDANQIRYSGNSLVFDPLGKELGGCGNKEMILSVKLDINVLKNYRSKFPVWQDADKFRLET
jgi:predicted amidohydrolase